MKRPLLLIGLMGIISSVHSQSGIGINTEQVENGIILQIESGTDPGGVLLPRISLTSTDIFAPITGNRTNGLIVYNINTSGTGDTAVTPGYYFWDNANSEWKKMSNKGTNDVALYANMDTSTDLNNGTSIMDLFSIERLNTAPSIFQKLSNTQMRINEIGFYKVTVTLDVAEDGGADNFGCEILINGISNIVTDNMYIPGRWDDEGGEESYFPIGKSFVIHIPINSAGSIISVQAYEIDPGTKVYFKKSDSSTISIEKIR